MQIRTVTSIITATVMLATMSAPTAALAIPPPPGTTPAPASDVDEIRLHTGGFLKGEIVEYMPGGYVVILPLGGGESKRVLWVDISEIVRDGKLEQVSLVEAQPQPQPADAPTPAPEQVEGAQIHIDQTRGDEPIALFHIDGEAVAFSGGYSARAIGFSEVCLSPCDIVLEDHSGEFFVAGDKYRGSKRFRLSGDAPGYDLRVKPGSKGMAIGGYVLAISAVVATSFMAAGPFLVDMPRTTANGVWAGAGLVGVFGIGGGITMMVLSRSKVAVSPRSR